jgi:hypothetical protein
VDIRADIYSLGATFYFMLTGKAPFAEGSVAQKLMWHQTRQPKPVRLLRPVVPEGVAAILERMMMKDRAARYQTPAELAGALARFVQTPIPPPPESEMPWLSPAAGGAMYAAVGGAAATSAPGRWPMPPAAAEGAAAVATATAQSTDTGPGGSPPRTPPTTHRASQTPHPQPVGPPPTPARRDEANPFAHMMGGGHNVYATAASRAAAASLPVATQSTGTELLSSKSKSTLWFVAATIGAIAIVGGAFAVWRQIGGPAGWW